MKVCSRLLRAAAMAVTISVPLATQAPAQEWPNRAVTLVIPFAAGSASDVVGRIFAARLSEVLGQQVVIENVGGAGGTIGVGRVSKADPDGYQFVMGGIDTFAMSKALYKKLPYDPVADFMPVALVAEQPIILMARKDLPVKNFKEFLAYAKSNPGKMQYGSAGVGSASHLGCAQLNAAAGIDAVHVPYRGSAPAMQDAMAGRIDYICALGAAAIPQMENKSLNPLAALTKVRSPLAPDVPTAIEEGISNFEAPFWSGFFVPKGTPQAVIDKLQKATVTMIETPILTDRLKKVGSTFVPVTQANPAYLKKFLDGEIEKWGATIKASGVSLD
jgi:tripartite-type tricarboxylate transporter receptor subunit TctC